MTDKGFIIRSENPWAVEFLAAMLKTMTDSRSASVVNILTRGAVGPQDVVVHSANDTGLWVSPYDNESDTVSRTSWTVLYTQILELTLY